MKSTSRLTVGLMALGLTAAPALAFAQSSGPYYALPSWSQNLPANVRFVLVLPETVCADNFCTPVPQAVLDRETGLVWERVPHALPLNYRDWYRAQALCTYKKIGNRFGWRLPTLQELESLADGTAGGGGALPAGNPFVLLPAFSEYFWSSTPFAKDGGEPLAWAVRLQNFSHSTDVFPPYFERLAWCVRGGAGLTTP